MAQNTQTVPTAVGDKTYQWAMHTAWGLSVPQVLKNVIETIGGYTYHKKIVSGANPNAILGSTVGTGAQQVITAGINNPDVPRVLTITISGSGEGTGNILITGVNVEGKPITDTIPYTTTGQVTGALAFKRVSSITIPAAFGASATLIVGTSNEIGLHHRLVPNYSSIVAISATKTTAYTDHTTTDFKSNFPIVQAAVAASNFDDEFVEKNWAQPTPNPNGTFFLYFFYWFYNVLVYPPKDSPEFYSTTTSTSTSMSSTSTSVSTSTSISSTSTSISSTSQSSTSSSISSTSASSTSTSTTVSGTTTSTSQSTSTSISSTSTSTTTLPF